MEAKDLMIGDWVQIDEPDRYAGAHGTICSLMHHHSDDGVYFHIFVQDKGIVLREVFNEDLLPIPLTKEILEKNGFDCSETIGFAKLSFVGGDNEGKFILRAMYDIKSDKQKGWGFFAFNVLTEVNYVHELQHALRLCKIDKKITL